MENILELAMKISESYCLERGIPINRKYEDEELSEPRKMLAEAREILEEME